MKRLAPRLRPAFTLIELLVVISIITLLIAILLPTLGAAREAGQSIKCQSQLRQYAIANEIHANDGKDYYVWRYGQKDLTSNPPVEWFASGNYQIYLLGRTGVNGYTEWPMELLCPTADLARSSPFGGTGGAVARAVAYNDEGRGTTPESPGLPRASVTVPSATIHFIEDDNWRAIPGATMSILHFGDTANSSFFDGHVESLKAEEIFNNDAYWEIHR